MKRTVRMLVLMAGLVGTYVAAAVPMVAAPDGGPIPLCPPGGKCEQSLPPAMK